MRQRTFVGAVLDDSEDLVEVTMSFSEMDGALGVEQYGEDFELDGEFVTYNDLVRRFGKARVDTFIEEAVQNAR